MGYINSLKTSRGTAWGLLAIKKVRSNSDQHSTCPRRKTVLRVQCCDYCTSQIAMKPDDVRSAMQG